jgi:hypothetical protein
MQAHGERKGRGKNRAGAFGPFLVEASPARRTTITEPCRLAHESADKGLFQGSIRSSRGHCDGPGVRELGGWRKLSYWKEFEREISGEEEKAVVGRQDGARLTQVSLFLSLPFPLGLDQPLSF